MREIDIFNKLVSERRVLDDHFQRLGELMLPRKSEFVTKKASGARRMENVYDSSPILAARDLASAISTLLKPRTQQWFNWRATNTVLNRNSEVKLWLEEVEKIMFNAMYRREARFVHASGEKDLDLVVFGTGIMFIGMTRNLRNLLFKPMLLKNSYILRNADSMVDTIYILNEIPAHAAVKFFDKPGETAKKAVEENKITKMIKYLQVVEPRPDRDPESLNALDMPFSSVWIDIEGEAKIATSGFREFPFVVPVWDTVAGEDYGNSPGMNALPDVNTVNEMAKTILRAGQKAVDPPLAVADDSTVSAVRTWPGGITYFNADAAKTLGQIPIVPLNTGADIALGLEMQEAIRLQIAEAFFKTRLRLPIGGPQMTATEVLERTEEFVMDFDPIFGRLETDDIGPTLDRVFNIMLRAGAFPSPPSILQGESVEFEYTSPITTSKRKLEAAGVTRSIEIMTPLIQADPTIIDIYDSDEIGYQVSEAQGMPLTMMRTPAEVEEIRQARIEAAQRAEEEARRAQDVENLSTAADAAAKTA